MPRAFSFFPNRLIDKHLRQQATTWFRSDRSECFRSLSSRRPLWLSLSLAVPMPSGARSAVSSTLAVLIPSLLQVSSLATSTSLLVGRISTQLQLTPLCVNPHALLAKFKPTNLATGLPSSTTNISMVHSKKSPTLE